MGRRAKDDKSPYTVISATTEQIIDALTAEAAARSKPAPAPRATRRSKAKPTAKRQPVFSFVHVRPERPRKPTMWGSMDSRTPIRAIATDGGWTMVELIFVLAIVALLAALVIPHLVTALPTMPDKPCEY